MGGVTIGQPLSVGRSIAVSAAGPAAGILLVGMPATMLLYMAGPLSRPILVALVVAAWVGIAWSVVNLLPVLPLDGGNIALKLLQHTMGHRGRRLAHQLSIAVAGV